MLCNPFIQLNTETDTQGMHMTISNIPNNFIAQACWLCCIKMAGYWPGSFFQFFFADLWTAVQDVAGLIPKNN